MREVSPCESGVWRAGACWRAVRMRRDKRGVADDLRVMRSIARKHGFGVLEEVVDRVDERSPNLG